MGKDSVRLATEAEALDVLRSEGVRHRLSVEPTAIQSGTPYLVNERLLFILMPLDSEKVEAHISCPKAHWRHIHSDIEGAIQFVIRLGYNEIYTNVTENLKTTQNLIEKHGFKYVAQVGAERIYRWA